MLIRHGLPPLAGLRYGGRSAGASEVEGDGERFMRADQVELNVEVGLGAQANVARRADGLPN